MGQATYLAILRRTTPAGTEDTVTLPLTNEMSIGELTDWLERYRGNCICDDLKIVKTDEGPSQKQTKVVIEEIFVEATGQAYAKISGGVVNLHTVSRVSEVRAGDELETDDHKKWVHRPTRKPGVSSREEMYEIEELQGPKKK